MEILGIFRDIESAAKAVAGLVRVGFTEDQIDSLTSVPYPEGALVRTKQSSWFRWLALTGGLSGALAGFVLVAGTASLYPVQTGDKPIIAIYPTAIICFEVGMLFAIIGTMVGMFLEMGLPALNKRVYDPAVAEGCIGISLTIHGGGDAVRCTPGAATEECIGAIASLSATEQRKRAEEIMQAAGVLRVIGEETP
jgi:hypothetical protein